VVFASNAQKIKSEKVTTSYLKYPKVQVNSLEGLNFMAAKSGDFVVGEARLKDTKSKCLPKGGSIKDVVEVPTYYYEIPVKTPSVIVSVKNAAGDVIFAEEVLKSADDQSLFGFDKCENWYKATLEKNWAEQGQEYMKNGNIFRIENAIEEAQNKIKSELFYELASKEIEVDWYKNKNHDYSELEEAAQIAVKGYEMFNESYNSVGAKEKLSEAITIWSKEIQNLDEDDKKARINTKVGKSIYTNMAHALMFAERFDEAAEAIQAAQALGPKNWTNATTMAQDELLEQIQLRKNDVAKFAGSVPVYAPDNIQIGLGDDAQYASLKADLDNYASNERAESLKAQMASYEAEKKKYDEAVAKGEINPYQDKMIKTTTQGYMLMLYNEDEFPIEVTELTELNQLIIQNGSITSIPKEIAALENLKRLNLSKNQLTSLPAEIGELKNLKSLNLKGNDIPQSDIDAVQAKLPKCKIKI
jgi:tetratricopeptide (TPR) repeat protein